MLPAPPFAPASSWLTASFSKKKGFYLLRLTKPSVLSPALKPKKEGRLVRGKTLYNY